jgi:hypothetical protein
MVTGFLLFPFREGSHTAPVIRAGARAHNSSFTELPRGGLLGNSRLRGHEEEGDAPWEARKPYDTVLTRLVGLFMHPRQHSPGLLQNLSHDLCGTLLALL